MTLSKQDRLKQNQQQIDNAKSTGHTSIIPMLESERLAIEGEMDESDLFDMPEPRLEEHRFIPYDGIRPELWPAIDQLVIDKSADYVDRLLHNLRKGASA